MKYLKSLWDTLEWEHSEFRVSICWKVNGGYRESITFLYKKACRTLYIYEPRNPVETRRQFFASQTVSGYLRQMDLLSRLNSKIYTLSIFYFKPLSSSYSFIKNAIHS